jgi:hypothetical protein
MPKPSLGNFANTREERNKSMRRIGTMILGLALLFAVSAMAEDIRSDVSVEGTGFFTKESNNRGISQRAPCI